MKINAIIIEIMLFKREHTLALNIFELKKHRDSLYWIFENSVTHNIYMKMADREEPIGVEEFDDLILQGLEVSKDESIPFLCKGVKLCFDEDGIYPFNKEEFEEALGKLEI